MIVRPASAAPPLRAATVSRGAAALLVALASLGAAVAAVAAGPDAGAGGRPPADVPSAVDAGLDRVMDAADRRHLLLRSGIGASASELLALEGLTRAEGIARVMDGLSTEPVLPMPPWTREPPPHYHARPDMDETARQRFGRERDRELGELRRWWIDEMLTTDSPQTERLVLFWHDLFATSYHGTDRAALAMARQNATFRRLATGSWAALLGAMLRDAALLDFLDANGNRAEAPNENLAREFLELFALGEGNYTQRDVAEAARALTGHGASDDATLSFRLRTWHQDTGEKTLFGVRGPHDGDDLVRLALAQPSAARHLATRFWQAFVADGPPAPDWLDTIASRFRASDHDVATLYRDTLSSAAFWADEHRGAIVRSPLDLVVGTARALDYPKARSDGFARLLADLDMALFAPPDVAGWREGDAFVTSGALLDRRRAVARVVRPPATGASLGSPVADGGAVAGGSMAGGSMDGGSTLAVRLAAEHYRGAAAWRVSLLDGDTTLWRDLVRVLDDGHDTERDGRLGGRDAMPWRDVAVPAPPDVLARADAVAVEFLNDTAGPDGDRNLHVDGALVDGRWLDASDGVQRGECVPENPLDAGSLWCAGTLVLRRPAAEVAEADTSSPWQARAAHLRWANADGDGGRHVAGIALDDVTTPEGAFHRVQFRLVAREDGPLEIEIEAFDCIPDCITDWPPCAWRDERFPRARLVAFPFDGRAASAREPCHLESVGARERALVGALARSADSLLATLATQPSGEAHAATLAALAERVATAERAPGAAFVVTGDASGAPSRAPSPRTPPPVAVGTPDALVAALDASGLGLVDILLAGIDDETLAPLRPSPEESATAAIARLTRHPAFQLR